MFLNPYLLSILSGVLLRLSFPKPNLWVFAWLAFVPLFFALEKQRPGKAFLISLICGTVFFITTMFWLINVTVPGMIVLSVYLALYVAVFGMAYVFIKQKFTFSARVTLIPALWVLLEFARGHFVTGMPWALLGTGQASNLLAIQAADIVGAYGVSFIVMFININIFEFIFWRKTGRAVLLPRAAAVFLVLFAWFGYGAYRIFQDPQKNCAFKVALVQGNISQEIKWAAGFKDNIFKKYQILTEIVNLKEEPDLIVWPETSYPDYYRPGEDNNGLEGFAQDAGVPLLAGSITLRDVRYFNSAILFGPASKEPVVYDKLHLVPFGEYIPARKFLPFIESILPIEDFSPGKGHVIFSLAGKYCPRMSFGTMICFEDIFGDIARGSVLRGADFLVNLTNDAWFGDTSSHYQHMQASVMRAVENRTYVIRAANTGISCFIDDTGKPYAMLRDAGGKPTFVTGYKAAWVAKTGRKSLYTRIGDVFALICIFYVIIMIGLDIKKKR
ncbi:MAG TPA: apolipoprotein N-acyltransferase [Candidatus Omnitrophica bacterium]|nr:apolipoprotein N-acyltransferase [Candidatus Omnitrophota bacterium]